MQRLSESAAMKLMKVMVSFRTQLDTRAVEKTQSDERLKQDMQHLMVQVHHKFVEVDTAIATISSTRAASSQIASQAAPQAVPRFVPQTAPSATAQVFGHSAQHLGRCSNEELAFNHTLEVEAKGFDAELC